MADRSVTGFKLYQKGNVSVNFEDEEYIFFDVKSKKETYTVEFEKKQGAWRCICPDYNGRHLKAPGSFTCKHIIASFFKLAEIKGVNQQAQFDVIPVKKVLKTA